MSVVIFKTEEAIFEFDQKSVLERLEQRKISYKIQELDLLLDVISSQPEKAILSLEEHQHFGFIALELLVAGKGSAFCKNCGKRYRFHQLKAFTVGPDETTFKVNTGKKGGFKSLFPRKPKPSFGMYGGKGFKCPEGHELIFMITWRT
jgi:hypothetical protein